MNKRPLPLPGMRLEAILSLIRPTNTIAEIGADHGILSAHIVRRGLCRSIIVADISAASLEKAMRLFSLHGLCDAASFRVADGLRALREPVDIILIAGMGAETIVSILDHGTDALKGAEIIVQANGKQHLLRRWLCDNGYRIENERLALEKRRFYVVIHGVPGEARYSEKEIYLGPCLMRERPVFWLEYLVWRKKCLAASKNTDNAGIMQWIDEEL